MAFSICLWQTIIKAVPMPSSKGSPTKLLPQGATLSILALHFHGFQLSVSICALSRLILYIC